MFNFKLFKRLLEFSTFMTYKKETKCNDALKKKNFIYFSYIKLYIMPL